MTLGGPEGGRVVCAPGSGDPAHDSAADAKMQLMQFCVLCFFATDAGSGTIAVMSRFSVLST